jgi:hypothetical protein
MANIILIGPEHVGKSTVAAWINHVTGRPHVSLDDRNHPFHASNLPRYHTSVLKSGSFMERYRSWKPFEALSAEMHVNAVDNHIIDFGAGHSVYDDEAQFERVAQATMGHHVVLLMPAEGLERSRKILLEQHPVGVNHEFINYVLDNSSNERLANITISRDAKSAKEIALEVLACFPHWAHSTN